MIWIPVQNGISITRNNQQQKLTANAGSVTLPLILPLILEGWTQARRKTAGPLPTVCDPKFSDRAALSQVTEKQSVNMVTSPVT